MGGGDSLYDKIDRGMRGCKAVVSCVTKKYSLSANCRREISLADALKKPIIPLLLEQMKWPPDGPMSMVFTELLYINFHKDEAIQMTWKGATFDELMGKLGHFVPEALTQGNNQAKGKTPAVSAATKTAGKKTVPPTNATSSSKDKAGNATKKEDNTKEKVDNGKSNTKDAPKNTTTTSTKVPPTSKAQVSNTKTEPKSVSSLNTASANKTGANKQQMRGDSKTVEMKRKTETEQQAKENNQKHISNGTAQSTPAKSKSCNIL